MQLLVINVFVWRALVPSIVLPIPWIPSIANKMKLFFHDNQISSEFLEVTIHTSDTNVVVLAFCFPSFLKCELLIKTESQE